MPRDNEPDGEKAEMSWKALAREASAPANRLADLTTLAPSHDWKKRGAQQLRMYEKRGNNHVRTYTSDFLNVIAQQGLDASPLAFFTAGDLSLSAVQCVSTYGNYSNLQALIEGLAAEKATEKKPGALAKILAHKTLTVTLSPEQYEKLAQLYDPSLLQTRKR